MKKLTNKYFEESENLTFEEGMALLAEEAKERKRKMENERAKREECEERKAQRKQKKTDLDETDFSLSSFAVVCGCVVLCGFMSLGRLIAYPVIKKIAESYEN